YLVQRVEYLGSKPQFQRAADLIAMRFNEGNPASLMDEIPHVSTGLQSMQDHFSQIADPLTREDVLNYFKSQAGSTALAEGTFDVPHFASTNLPRIGRVGGAVTDFKLGVRASLDNFRLVDY